MTNATDFWTAMTNCGVVSPAGTGTQTCDGNGNGRVSSPAAASQTGEIFTFWQHLSNAGLIEGRYTGIAGTGGADDSEFDENVPSSKLSSAGWYARFLVHAGDALITASTYGNSFIFGGSTASTWPVGGVLTPEEAWNIDTKIDDGMPQQGSVWAQRWDFCTDSTSFSDLQGEYLLNVTDVSCALIYKNAF